MNQRVNWSELLYDIFTDVLPHWATVLLVAVLVGIGGDLAQTLLTEPVYCSEMSVVFERTNSPGVAVTDNTAVSAEKGVGTAINYILQSNVYTERVAEQLGMESLPGYFSAESVEGTGVVLVKATAPSPKLAYQMMRVFIENYDEVFRMVMGNAQINALSRLQVPITPANPVRHLRNLALYTFLAGALYVAILAALSFFRPTLKSKELVEDELRIKLIGDVPEESKYYHHGLQIRHKPALLVSQLSTSHYFINSFQRMTSTFTHAMRKYDAKVLVISSSAENEGKTSVAVNLAMTLAQQGYRTLVIDGDLRKPSLALIMDAEGYERSIDGALRGEYPLVQAVTGTNLMNLEFIYCDKPMPDPGSYIENGVLAEGLRALRAEYDYIFLDSPPAAVSGDTELLANLADAVALVVRQNYVPMGLIDRTLEKFGELDTRVIGCIVNRSWNIEDRVRRTNEKHGGVSRNDK